MQPTCNYLLHLFSGVLSYLYMNDVTHKKYLVGLRDTIILVLRRELGLTGADIALIMGIDKATVSRVLSRRKQKPTVEKLLKKLR